MQTWGEYGIEKYIILRNENEMEDIKEGIWQSKGKEGDKWDVEEGNEKKKVEQKDYK